MKILSWKTMEARRKWYILEVLKEPRSQNPILTYIASKYVKFFFFLIKVFKIYFSVWISHSQVLSNNMWIMATVSDRSKLEQEGERNMFTDETENTKSDDDRLWVPEGWWNCEGSGGSGNMSPWENVLNDCGNKSQNIKDDLDDLDFWRWPRQAET